ncbi:MAG: ribosome recycling factor [Planctomycetota bacterium]|jgi:ribosome recycling factor|nr:ribosome recycling factor [Planctomycetota bacterium]
MPVANVITSIRDNMEKALEHLRKDFRLTRTGRPTPALLDGIRVNAYGAQTPVRQCANISVPEARQLMLKPFDLGLLKEIEKALMASDLGVTPQNDGKIIRLIFPPLTEDRRKKLVQEVRAKGEDAKVTVRNVRRDGLKLLEDAQKRKEISEDDLKREKDKVQDILKEHEKKIDREVDEKAKEIMEI